MPTLDEFDSNFKQGGGSGSGDVDNLVIANNRVETTDANNGGRTYYDDSRHKDDQYSEATFEVAAPLSFGNSTVGDTNLAGTRWRLFGGGWSGAARTLRGVSIPQGATTTGGSVRVGVYSSTTADPLTEGFSLVEDLGQHTADLADNGTAIFISSSAFPAVPANAYLWILALPDGNGDFDFDYLAAGSLPSGDIDYNFSRNVARNPNNALPDPLPTDFWSSNGLEVGAVNIYFAEIPTRLNVRADGSRAGYEARILSGPIDTADIYSGDSLIGSFDLEFLPVYRINVGGAEIVAPGMNWAIDNTATASPYRAADDTAQTSAASYPDADDGPHIGLPDYFPVEALTNIRWCHPGLKISYDFPVTAGQTYRVRSYYSEVNTSDRTFDITIDGVLVADDYVPYVEGGNSLNVGTMVEAFVTPATSTLNFSITQGGSGSAYGLLQALEIGVAPKAGVLHSSGVTSAVINDSAPDGFQTRQSFTIPAGMSAINQITLEYATSALTCAALYKGGLTTNPNGATLQWSSDPYTSPAGVHTLDCGNLTCAPGELWWLILLRNGEIMPYTNVPTADELVACPSAFWIADADDPASKTWEASISASGTTDDDIRRNVSLVQIARHKARLAISNTHRISVALDDAWADGVIDASARRYVTHGDPQNAVNSVTGLIYTYFACLDWQEAGQLLDSIEVHFGNVELGTQNAAVFSGGTATDPTGATLVADLGTLNTTVDNIWHEFRSVSNPAIPTGYLWLAIRGTDNNDKVQYSGVAGDYAGGAYINSSAGAAAWFTTVPTVSNPNWSSAPRIRLNTIAPGVIYNDYLRDRSGFRESGGAVDQGYSWRQNSLILKPPPRGRRLLGFEYNTGTGTGKHRVGLYRDPAGTADQNGAVLLEDFGEYTEDGTAGTRQVLLATPYEVTGPDQLFVLHVVVGIADSVHMLRVDDAFISGYGDSDFLSNVSVYGSADTTTALPSLLPNEGTETTFVYDARLIWEVDSGHPGFTLIPDGSSVAWLDDWSDGLAEPPAPSTVVSLLGTPSVKTADLQTYTAETGSDRVVVFACEMHNASGSNLRVASLTFGGVSATYLAGDLTNSEGGDVGTAIFYIKEASIPSGAQTVDVAHGGAGPDDIRITCFTLDNVNQTTPTSYENEDTGGSGDTCSFPTVTVNDGGYIITIGNFNWGTAPFATSPDDGEATLLNVYETDVGGPSGVWHGAFATGKTATFSYVETSSNRSASTVAFTPVGQGGLVPVEDTFQIPFGVQDEVEDTLQIPFDVLVEVEDTFQLQWQIDNEVEDTFEIPFGVGAEVEDTFQIPFSVGAEVEDTFQIPFQIGDSIVDSLTLPFDVRAEVEDTFQIPFDVRAEVEDTFQIPFEVESSVLTPVTDTLQIPFSVGAEVVDAFQIPFEIFQRTEDTLEIPFHILNEVEKPVTIPFSVDNEVEDVLSLPFDVNVEVEDTLTLPWSGEGSVTSILTLPFTVRSSQMTANHYTLLTGDSSDPYNTGTVPVESSLTLPFAVATDTNMFVVEDSITLPFQIQTNAPETGYLPNEPNIVGHWTSSAYKVAYPVGDKTQLQPRETAIVGQAHFIVRQGLGYDFSDGRGPGSELGGALAWTFEHTIMGWDTWIVDHIDNRGFRPTPPGGNSGWRDVYNTIVPTGKLFDYALKRNGRPAGFPQTASGPTKQIAVNPWNTNFFSEWAIRHFSHVKRVNSYAGGPALRGAFNDGWQEHSVKKYARSVTNFHNVKAQINKKEIRLDGVLSLGVTGTVTNGYSEPKNGHWIAFINSSGTQMQYGQEITGIRHEDAAQAAVPYDSQDARYTVVLLAADVTGNVSSSWDFDVYLAKGNDTGADYDQDGADEYENRNGSVDDFNNATTLRAMGRMSMFDDLESAYQDAMADAGVIGAPEHGYMGNNLARCLIEKANGGLTYPGWWYQRIDGVQQFEHGQQYTRFQPNNDNNKTTYWYNMLNDPVRLAGVQGLFWMMDFARTYHAGSAQGKIHNRCLWSVETCDGRYLRETVTDCAYIQWWHIALLIGSGNAHIFNPWSGKNTRQNYFTDMHNMAPGHVAYTPESYFSGSPVEVPLTLTVNPDFTGNGMTDVELNHWGPSTGIGQYMRWFSNNWMLYWNGRPASSVADWHPWYLSGGVTLDPTKDKAVVEHLPDGWSLYRAHWQSYISPDTGRNSFTGGYVDGFQTGTGWPREGQTAKCGHDPYLYPDDPSYYGGIGEEIGPNGTEFDLGFGSALACRAAPSGRYA